MRKDVVRRLGWALPTGWAIPTVSGWEKRWAMPTLRVLVLAMVFAMLAFPARAGKWAGVDEAVVERIAAEHGRQPAAGLFGGMEGDLRLFFFLVIGAAGGFAGGYWYRMLTEKRREKALLP